MENLILQLQTLIDQIEHEGLGLHEVKEKKHPEGCFNGI